MQEYNQSGDLGKKSMNFRLRYSRLFFPELWSYTFIGLRTANLSEHTISALADTQHLKHAILLQEISEKGKLESYNKAISTPPRQIAADPSQISSSRGKSHQ